MGMKLTFEELEWTMREATMVWAEELGIGDPQQLRDYVPTMQEKMQLGGIFNELYARDLSVKLIKSCMEKAKNGPPSQEAS